MEVILCKLKGYKGWYVHVWKRVHISLVNVSNMALASIYMHRSVMHTCIVENRLSKLQLCTSCTAETPSYYKDSCLVSFLSV